MLNSAFLFLQNLYASKPVPLSKIKTSRNEVRIVNVDSSAGTVEVVTEVTTNTDVTVNAGSVVVLVPCVAVGLVTKAVAVIEEETNVVEEAVVNVEKVGVGVGVGVEIVVNVGVLVKVYADVWVTVC